MIRVKINMHINLITKTEHSSFSYNYIIGPPREKTCLRGLLKTNALTCLGMTWCPVAWQPIFRISNMISMTIVSITTFDLIRASSALLFFFSKFLILFLKTVQTLDILDIVVVVFVFNVPPTVKVIWRWDHSLESHPTDWWSRESNLRPLVYKASSLSTTPQPLLYLRYLNGLWF